MIWVNQDRHPQEKKGYVGIGVGSTRQTSADLDGEDVQVVHGHAGAAHNPLCEGEWSIVAAGGQGREASHTRTPPE